MNLYETLQAPALPTPSLLARLALDDDRASLLELFRLHLARVSPDLKFDARTANATIDNYLRTANPTILVAEDRERRVVGYLLATFNDYVATAGYYVCAEEMYAPLSALGIEVAAALGTGFEAWTEQLKPAPLEVMLGLDVELVPPTAPGQHKGGH